MKQIELDVRRLGRADINIITDAWSCPLIVVLHGARSVQLEVQPKNPVVQYTYKLTAGLSSSPKTWEGALYLKADEGEGSLYFATETLRFDALWQASEFLLSPFVNPNFEPPET